MDINKFWIPVTEALPKHGDRVLVVCVNRNNQTQRHVSICEYWGNYYGRPPLFRWSGNKLVSHWAPLPDIPGDNPINLVRLSGHELTPVTGLEELRTLLREHQKKGERK